MDIESSDETIVEKKPKNLNSIKEQLEQCVNVLRAIQELIKFIGIKNLRDSHGNSELELRTNLEDQLRLIDKPYFEVAVVGKEKAGKSMLLNGWLDFHLLPSKKERCTYTTIEIRSCVSSHDEKFCIEYLTKKEFDEILKEKYKLIKLDDKNDLLKKEIEEIEANKIRIEEYLGKKEIEKSINNFKDAEKELNSAITDPGHARAVKKINIYTHKLLEEDKVAFYDVPGYDSPITYHKELTKQKLAEVDAILFAKEFDKPSLNEAETEILDRSESYSKFIKTKDKVIVALTKCDSILTRSEYSKLLKSSQSSLQKYHIPESRIIPVCALAAFTEETAEIKASKKRLADLKIEDGMSRLKAATKECVSQLRLTIANERCDSTKRKIEDLWNNVCSVIKSEYEVDFNSEIRDKVEKEEMNKKFNEWFVTYWNDLMKSFQNFFIQKICPKSNVDMPTFQSEEDRSFKKAYQEIIEESFNEITTLKTKRQKAIYEAEMSNQQVVDPMQGNIAIRVELAREATDKLNKITMGLNELLWKKYDEIIDWIRANMWNMTEIRREMIGVDEKAEKFIMQSCFDALIQRLARPATEIFLRFPRSKIIRRKILEEYKLELIILDNFIVDGRIKPRGLVHFLASGEHKEFKIDERVEAPEIVRNALSFSNMKDENEQNKEEEKEDEKDEDDDFDIEVDVKDERETPVFESEIKPDEYQRDSQFDGLDYVNPAGNFESINKEINEDAKEYLECLKNSVFYGSGLLRFYKQELDRMRRRFIELEKDKRTWTQLVNKHWEENDSRIPAPNMVTIIKKKSSIVRILKDAQQLIDQFEY